MPYDRKFRKFKRNYKKTDSEDVDERAEHFGKMNIDFLPYTKLHKTKELSKRIMKFSQLEFRVKLMK